MTDRKPRGRLWRWAALVVALVVLGLLYEPLKDFGAELFRLWS